MESPCFDNKTEAHLTSTFTQITSGDDSLAVLYMVSQ